MDTQKYDEVTKRIALLTQKRAFLADIKTPQSQIEITLCNAELASLFEQEDQLRREMFTRRRSGLITTHDALVSLGCLMPLFVMFLLRKVDFPLNDQLLEQGWWLIVEPIVVWGFVIFGVAYVMTARITRRAKRIRNIVTIVYPFWMFWAVLWINKYDDKNEFPIGELIALPAMIFLVLPMFIHLIANLMDDRPD